MKRNLTDRMAQVSEILIQLAGSPIPSQQFQILVDYAGLVVPHDFLAFCLIDDESEQCLVFPLVGTARDAIPERPFPLSAGILGRVLSNRKSEIIANLADDGDALPDLEQILVRFGLPSALVIPIRQERKVLGALYFATSAAACYSADDLQIGRLLAAGLASSLETSRLYQRLADEKSTLSAVLTSTSDGVLVVNENGTVLLANPAFETMFALPNSFMAGQQIGDYLQDGALLAMMTEAGAALEVKLADGRVVQARSAQVITEFGELVGWAVVFRDITLLKELEEMKNEFVNTVSHDLKNPINAILLSSDLLTKTGQLNEQQLKLQGRIEKTAVYMNELVSELLDLGKIQAGLDLHPTTFALPALIQEVLQTLEVTIEQKKQQIHLSHPENVTLTANERRVKQVLLNLISNAIKYTPAQGEITITITENQRQANLQVSVSDTGIGIPAQDVPHIFDKFYRVHNEDTKNIKGTGLGLAITRSIVEAHNGRIWVDSIPGKGSTITFTLPQLSGKE